MAMFREHVALGAILSMIVVVGVYFYALLTDPILLVFLFGVTVVGSFLPDVDSDSGIPFYLVFGTASLFATGIVLLYTLDSTYASDWRYLTGIPAAALFVFWFVVGGIVKRCTHHRGIFHSIPALAIAGLGSFLLARYYGLDDTTAWIFGGAMAIGYLSHLVLDEMHAGITLDGIPFNPKSSFGSALKFFSRSVPVNIAAYLLLALMAYSAFTTPALAFYSSDLDSASGRLAFYNDSDVIEIEDDAPPLPVEGDGAAPGGTGGTSGTSMPGAGGSSDTSGSDDADDSSGGITGGGSSGGGGAASAGSGRSGSNGSSAGADAAGDVDDVIDLLVASGAVTGVGTGSGAAGEAGVGFSSGSVVTIVGDAVRQAFSGRNDLRDILDGWRTARETGAGDARDYGLVAASTALSDANVEAVTFSASAFGVTYRSRGYLFGLFPWTFPVRVEVVPQAPQGQRASVKLPWYNFFVREFFTRASLAADIEETLKAAAAEAAAAEDQNAYLFEAVARLLRSRVGTLSESVLPGA